MNRFALTLLASVMATSAHAGASKLSLMQCGLQFGEESGPSKSYSVRIKNREFLSEQVVRSIELVQPTVNAFTQTTAKPKVRRRIPPTFTFAKFVCSF